MSMESAKIIHITKSCNNCGLSKPLDEFKKNKNCKEGRLGQCRNCLNIKACERYNKNAKKIREAQRLWEKNHPEKVAEWNQKKYNKRKQARIANRLAKGGYLQGERITSEGKYCGACKKRFPLESFTKTKYSPDGYCGDCRPCKKMKAKEWHDKNKDKYSQYRKKHSRKSHLKRTYNLSLEGYRILFESQGGKCAICRNEIKKMCKYPNIDHDHSTGKVRGILCRGCNHGLGNFKDNIEFMKSAISYLLRAKGDN